MNLATYNPLEQGLMLGLVGPPGFGKSTFIRGSAAFGKLFVLLSPAREAVTYAGLDAEGEVIEEVEWDPAGGKYVAKAFTETMKLLRSLRSRKDIRIVGLDTASRQLQFAMNLALSPSAADEPLDKFAFYRQVKAKSIEYADALEALRSTGKHILAAFHQDVREIEGAGTPQVVIEQGKKKLQWEQGKAPDVAGSFRDSIAGRFDFFAFLERDIVNEKATYWLRVNPSERAWAKCAVPAFNGRARIPADFKEVMIAVDAYLKKGKVAG